MDAEPPREPAHGEPTEPPHKVFANGVESFVARGSHIGDLKFRILQIGDDITVGAIHDISSPIRDMYIGKETPEGTLFYSVEHYVDASTQRPTVKKSLALSHDDFEGWFAKELAFRLKHQPEHVQEVRNQFPDIFITNSTEPDRLDDPFEGLTEDQKVELMQVLGRTEERFDALMKTHEEKTVRESSRPSDSELKTIGTALKLMAREKLSESYLLPLQGGLLLAFPALFTEQ